MADYGSEVAPNGPVQDMAAFDPIAGTFPPQERNAPQAGFTGGMGGAGLGGQAEPPAADKLNIPGGGPTPGNTGSAITTSNG